MSVQPVSDDEASVVRSNLTWILGIAAAVAVLIFFTSSWLDTRKTPVIVFVATPQQGIAVEVRGAISTPGVIYLTPGDRMVDVIRSSGGFTSNADQSLINLSSRVADGQVIIIPTMVPAGEGGTSQSGFLININTASVEELKQLPGIGDVLAQRIVNWREFNGPFQRPDDLGNVDGISPSLVESLLPYITVTGDD